MNRLFLGKLFVATLYGASFSFITWLLIPNLNLVEVMTPVTIFSLSIGVFWGYCVFRDRRRQPGSHNIND